MGGSGVDLSPASVKQGLQPLDCRTLGHGLGAEAVLQAGGARGVHLRSWASSQGRTPPGMPLLSLLGELPASTQATALGFGPQANNPTESLTAKEPG